MKEIEKVPEPTVEVNACFDFLNFLASLLLGVVC